MFLIRFKQLKAIEVQSQAVRVPSDVYGGGDAGQQIADLLAKLPFTIS